MNTEEKTLVFRTNINCSGCVAQVTPALEGAEGVCHWNVDTSDKNKTLVVHSTGITADQVIQKVNEAGFQIELLNQ